MRDRTPAPAELLQDLLRFDTTNPPGNEGPCQSYLRELFEARGIRTGIGGGGARPEHIGGRPFYPIMVAEKRACRLRVTLRGPGGYASRSHRGGTMARLGEMLVALDRSPLPVHVIPVVSGYVQGI